jgi:Domain of unknown function (DUF4157)
MNRDAHQGRVEQRSSTAQARVPAAGKQTLTQRAADFAGVAAGSHGESSDARPQEQRAGTQPMIQRQETGERSDQRSGDKPGERGESKRSDPARAFAAAASGSFAEIPYRAEMEARFAADFSSVQSFAGRGLDDLGALAATRGEQVVFASEAPDRQTVAHELTHVLQSRQGLTSGGKVMSDPGDASEHEARDVAAALDGPAASGEAAVAVAVAAAPSGAIHRQEHQPAPHPSHLDAGGHRARPIDWNAARGTMQLFAPEFVADDPVRDIYNLHLLHNLALELPGELDAYAAAASGPALPEEALSPEDGRGSRAAAVDALLAFLNARMAAHLAEPDAEAGHVAAEAIRVPLFRASQQALVSTLNVEHSSRYAQTMENGAITQTFCNVFAYDMVTAMGAYLPRVWWKHPATAQADPTLDANLDNTFQLSANALYQWMLDWGPSFGWRSVPTPTDARTEANHGKVVIILAGHGKVNAVEPGHVSVVMAESDALGLHGGDLPLQAQAGEVNYSNSSAMVASNDGAANTATSEWWNAFSKSDLPALKEGETRSDNMSEWGEYASGYGFFVYEGAARGEVSIRTPEETGLVLPAPAAPAAPDAEASAEPPGA